nr:hypothetical protein OG409_07890 [Streptomyces sp. NBC_00974]
MTGRSQADEGLRRALGDTPTEAVRGILRAVAQRLREERPGDPMREANRLALALTYSERRFGTSSALAREAERQFLGLTPRIEVHLPRGEAPISRGEYALILDRAASRA